MAVNALRTLVVTGVTLVAVAGLCESLDLDAVVGLLRALGAALVLGGALGETLTLSLPTPALAASVLGPLAAAGIAASWVLASAPDERPVNEPIGTLVAVGAPVLVAAARSLLGKGGSTWYVGVAGASALLVGGVIVFLHRALGPEAFGVIGLGSALLVTYSVTDRDAVGEAATARSTVYGGGALVLVALAGALAVGVYALARRSDRTWDWTRTGDHTLSDQSRRVAAALPVDVEVEAFFGRDAFGRERFVELMALFGEASDRIAVEWVDPLSNPTRAKQSHVTGTHGTALFRAGERERRLEGEIHEEDIVRALIGLSAQRDHEVCWVTGHGEPDPDVDTGAGAFGGIRTEIEHGNYQVLRVPTAQVGVPPTCTVLLDVAPQVDWLPYEREALAAFLASGGAAAFLLDAGTVPELADELGRYGIEVGEDVVVDQNLKNHLMGVSDPRVVVLSAEDFGSHPITQDLGAALVMPLARSVRARRDATGLTVQDLLRTSPDAWGETDWSGAEPEPNPGIEVVGEVPVMAVAVIDDPAVIDVAVPDPEPDAPQSVPSEPLLPDVSDRARGVPPGFAPKPGGKLVVVGNATFASNDDLGYGNNRDLVLNTIAWLAREEQQLGERPPASEALEVSEAGAQVIALTSLLGVPGLALLAASATLLRRRYL